jgi:acyl-CoA reductase-like NAD-dependent aldehyde dehydrogenase
MKLAPEQAMTIGGARAATHDTFDVVNPSTAAVLGHAPDCTSEQLDGAMSAAQSAFHGSDWRHDEHARQSSLSRAADVLEAAASEVVPILTAEQGKPLVDAQVEILTAVAWLRYFADLEAPADVVEDGVRGRAEVFYRPLGVVAAITPWNFPIALAMWKIAPALRAGNTMVLKPSPYTPLTTLAIGEMLQKALPPGVLNVISGRDPLGSAMCTHPAVRKISFTGSTATGKRVAAAAADDLKRTTLELGGNDAAIVLGDVDTEAIADALFWSAFGNNGQTCLAVKRVYVEQKLHGDVVEALSQRARTVSVGDGFTAGVQLGPINNQPQFNRVSGLVADALAHGATVTAGGKSLGGPGYFYAPTILTDLSDGTAIVDEEQFGPALPIMAFSDPADAVKRANAGNYGLTASVWAGDRDRAYALARGLDCGQVSINCHGGAARPDLPFGGHKWSGVGVENGIWGLRDFTETQVISVPAADG